MFFATTLSLASVIYKVLLLVKYSMFLYELKMVVHIEIHLAINRMCWLNCSRCLKVGNHCPVNTPGKQSAKQTASIHLGYSEAH